VLLNCGEDVASLLPQITGPRADAPPVRARRWTCAPTAWARRSCASWASRRMRLLGSPRRMPSMTGYGLEVTGFVSAKE
jgi:3,4-dihydroxy 2-butanone 4-phosphate synthase/GTP cyclohydrolase II